MEEQIVTITQTELRLLINAQSLDIRQMIAEQMIKQPFGDAAQQAVIVCLRILEDRARSAEREEMLLQQHRNSAHISGRNF